MGIPVLARDKWFPGAQPAIQLNESTLGSMRVSFLNTKVMQKATWCQTLASTCMRRPPHVCADMYNLCIYVDMYVCIPPCKCAHTHIIHRYTSYTNKEEQCKDLYAEGSQTVLGCRHQWPFTQTTASPWISVKGHHAHMESSSRGGELPRLLTQGSKANLLAGRAKSGSLHHRLT